MEDKGCLTHHKHYELAYQCTDAPHACGVSVANHRDSLDIMKEIIYESQLLRSFTVRLSALVIAPKLLQRIMHAVLYTQNI